MDNRTTLDSVVDAVGKTTADVDDRGPLDADLVQITDPNGQVTTLPYDASHRLTSLPLGSGSAVAGT